MRTVGGEWNFVYCAQSIENFNLKASAVTFLPRNDVPNYNLPKSMLTACFVDDPK